MTNEFLNVFKEVRFYYYFYITLLIWTCSSSTKDLPQDQLILNLSKKNLLLIILSLSVVGNMLYILFSNLFLGDTSLIYDQGTENALGQAISKKFIITPYIIAFTQSYSILVILSEKKSLSLKYLMAFLLFGASAYVAFFSNLRAGILAWVIGAAVSIIYVLLSKSTKNLSRVYVRLFIFLVIVCISMYFLISYLTLEYPRFTEQIFEKDASLNFSGRSNILLDTFFSFDVISIYGIFGRGFGASVPLASWRNNSGALGNYGNPLDSTFLNISVSFGYPFLILYICLLIISSINILKYISSIEGANTHKQALNLHIPLLASFLSLVLNNFNNSAFLFLPNCIITGILFGYTLSLSRDTERSD